MRTLVRVRVPVGEDVGEGLPEREKVRVARGVRVCVVDVVSVRDGALRVVVRVLLPLWEAL